MDDQFNVDTRLSKKFGITGGLTVEGIIDVFNLLDRTNYTEINNIFGRGAFPGSPQTGAQGRVTYGVYEQVLPGRQIQIAAKVSF